MRHRSYIRPFAIAAMSLGLIGAGVAQASAHVTVAGTDAVRGGSDAIVSFRVPTESDTASTVELDVALPIDTPLAGVLVKTHPGWTATVSTVKLTTPIKTDDGDITQAVSQIAWKADNAAAAIKPGDFDQFDVIVGQLPDVASLTFKAIQTYSDKSIVKWIETQAPGSTADLDHPAPVLMLTANAAQASAPATSTPTVTAAPVQAANSDAASKSSVRVAYVVAIIGVVLGAAGVGLGVRRRRT